MTLAASLSLFLALTTAAFAPGPVLLLMVSRAASGDARGATWLAIGATLGNLVLVGAVMLGLSTSLASNPDTLALVKFALLTYIAWTGWCMWRRNSAEANQIVATLEHPGVALMAGFTSGALSPFLLVLLPMFFADLLTLGAVTPAGVASVVLVVVASKLVSATSVITLASRLGGLVGSANWTLVVNRTLASLLVAGGGLLTFT